MTRVLLIGNGAREHAIAAALVKSGVELHAHMDRRNPGISKLAKEITIGSTIDYLRLPKLDVFDYVVIGPEAPLEKGVSDFIIDAGISCIAPSKITAKIETSKSFARSLLANVAPEANPEFVIARSIDQLRGFEDKIGFERVVVKPDGLTGGKGVKIFGEHLHSREELEKYAIGLLAKGGIVILEEKLQGIEFTVQAFSDGLRLSYMPLVRDFKRAFDDDKGPNTRSMGSYSKEDHTLDFVTEADLMTAKQIMDSTILGIKKNTKSEYKGILYGQFIKTTQGIKVIEFNARFGDSEAMNVLSILSTSFDKICNQIIDGNLGPVEFSPHATVCVYIVPEGYPGPNPVKDWPIDVEDGVQSEIYYASVYEKENQILTTESRAIAVLGKGNTVADARFHAYEDVKRVRGKIRYRSDIGANE